MHEPNLPLLYDKALKSREARMVTPAMGAAMKDQIFSLRENGAQHGFHLRHSTFQGSTLQHLS